MKQRPVALFLSALIIFLAVSFHDSHADVRYLFSSDDTEAKIKYQEDNR